MVLRLYVWSVRIFAVTLLVVLCTSLVFAQDAFEVPANVETPNALPGSGAEGEGAVSAPYTLPEQVSPALNTLAPEQYCAAILPFGSVVTNLTVPFEGTSAGSVVPVTALITNTRDFVLTDLQVYATVYKMTERTDEERRTYGYDVVATFLVNDAVVLSPQESLELPFEWTSPSGLGAGEYMMSLNVVSGYRMPLMGDVTLDAPIGGTVQFTLTQHESVLTPAYWDKTTIMVNDTPYAGMGGMSLIQNGEDVVITADVVNPTDAEKVVAVTWRVYTENALRADRLIHESSNGTVLPPNERSAVTYTVPFFPALVEKPDVLVVGEVRDNNNATSYIVVRYARPEIQKIHLVPPFVLQYPLTRGVEQSVVSCVSAFGDISEATVEITIIDAYGTSVFTDVHTGMITTALEALLRPFVPERTITNFSVVSTVMKDGIALDTVTVNYACEEIDASLCGLEEVVAPSSVPTMSVEGRYIGLASLVLIAFGVLIIFRARRTPPQRAPETPSV